PSPLRILRHMDWMRRHPGSLDYLPLPVPGYPHFDTRPQLIIREQQYLNIKLEKTTSYEIVCSTYLKLCFLLSSVHHLNNHSEQESRKLYLYFNYFFNLMDYFIEIGKNIGFYTEYAPYLVNT